MRTAYKIIIGGLIALVLLIGVPLGVAAATGKSEALQGLIQVLKWNWKCLVSTLEKNIQAYVKFLGGI